MFHTKNSDFCIIFTDGSKSDSGGNYSVMLTDDIIRFSVEFHAIELQLICRPITDGNHNYFLVCADSLSPLNCLQTVHKKNKNRVAEKNIFDIRI